jgi:hypothetical protein
MARIRSIKPEFFTSISIADLSRDARLMFIGMWTHVDDDGRCIDEPRLIKAALFPLDDDLEPTQVDALMWQLAAHGRIIRYAVDGRRYVQIVGFKEHQKIDRHTPSKHPSCEDSANTQRGVDEDAASTRPLIGSDRIGSGSDLEDSRHADPVDNDRFDLIVKRVVFNREQRQHQPPRNPTAWRTKVRTSVIEEHTQRIHTLMDTYPDAPHDVLAAAVDGETRSLGHYGTLGTGS